MGEFEASSPGAPDAEMTAERTLGQRLHVFSNMISGHYYRRTERPFGVRLPEWRVLRSVILQPDSSQAEVAATEGLNVMNVSRAVAGLRRKGLVSVTPDPEDRRRQKLSVTSLGREIGSDIAERERVIYEYVFSVLSGEEIEQFDELIDRVNSFVRGTELPDPPAQSRDWADLIDRDDA